MGAILDKTNMIYLGAYLDKTALIPFVAILDKTEILYLGAILDKTEIIYFGAILGKAYTVHVPLFCFRFPVGLTLQTIPAVVIQQRPKAIQASLSSLSRKSYSSFLSVPRLTDLGQNLDALRDTKGNV